MEAIQVVAPLIGVVLGSVLAGIGAHWRARQERKRVVAGALADLLEVRHRLVAFNTVLDKVRQLSGVAPAAMPGIRNLFDSMLPVDPALGERYNTAVSLLAGIDPVLAFSLRSKETLPKLISGLRTKAMAEGVDLGMYETFESQLLIAAKPAIDKAILELARSHSLVTLRKVKRYMVKSAGLPDEATQFFEQMIRLSASEGVEAQRAT